MPIATPFSPEEVRLLRQHYYTHCAKGMTKFLPDRTPAQIASRAAYEGLKCDPEVANSFKRNQEPLPHLTYVADPFVAYMLGFLWADGYVGRKTFHIRLKIADSDFLDIKDRWLATAKSWRYRTYHDGHPQHAIQALVELNHKGFYDFLVKNDYRIKSGATACKILSAIPEPLRHYWWRGYFDGDGCLVAHARTRRVSLTSCHDQDWTFFSALAKELPLVYRISCRNEGSSRNSTIHIENEANLRRFMDYIYQGEAFGLTRKRQAYEDYLTYKATCRPNKTSHYRGVCWDEKRGKWKMQIYKDRRYQIRFDTEEEAARAYDDMATKLFGDKAVLNFPS